MGQPRLPDIFSAGNCGSTIVLKVFRTLALQQYESGQVLLDRMLGYRLIESGIRAASDEVLLSDLENWLQGTDARLEYNHVRLAERALEQIGRPRPWSFAKLLMARAYTAGDYAAVRSAAQEVLRAGGKKAAPEVVLHCSNMLGQAYSAMGNFESAVRHWSRGAAVAAKAKLDFEEWDQRTGLIWCYQSLDQPFEALREVEAAESIACRMKDCDALSKTLIDQGNTLTDLGRRPEARHALEGALYAARVAGNASRQSDALGNLGSIALNEGRLAEAEGYHRRALEISLTLPDRQSAQFDFNNLAQVLWAQGRSEESLEAEKQAIAIAHERADQENIERYSASARKMSDALGRPEKAASTRATRGDRAPEAPSERSSPRTGRPADANEKEVRSLLNAGRLGDAKQFLEQRIAENPTDPGVRSLYSILLAKAGDLDGAIEQIETATRLAPEDIGVHFRRVDQYTSANRLDELKVIYESAIAEDPFRAAPRVGLALTYSRMGRTDEAAQQAQEAVTLAADDPFPRRVLAEAQFNTAVALVAPDWDAAWAAFQDCATTLNRLAYEFPDPHGQWHFYAAKCMEEFAMLSYQTNPPFMGGMDIQELQLLGWAMKHLLRAREQDPERVVDPYMNRIDSTIRAFARPQQLAEVARVFRKQNDLSIALGMLTVSLQMQPEQGYAYSELALTMDAMGDRMGARNYIAQAMQYDPNNEEYLEVKRRLDLPQVERPNL